MKILVDENIPNLTVQELINRGNDVKDIRGTKCEGISDSKLWILANDEKRLLISTDKGFSVKRHINNNGILIIRLKHPNKLKIHQHIMIAFDKINKKSWRNLTVVVRDTTMSIFQPKK